MEFDACDCTEHVNGAFYLLVLPVTSIEYAGRWPSDLASIFKVFHLARWTARTAVFGWTLTYWATGTLPSDSRHIGSGWQTAGG
jgi:hypothetical protein